MEDNNRRVAGNYQRLLGRLEDNGGEREILQARRDQSVTFSYREGYPGADILRPTEGLEHVPGERTRDVYVRRTSGASSTNNGGIESSAAYHRYHFRMIDASAADLSRDPTDRTRRYPSNASSPNTPTAAAAIGSSRSRLSSVSSDSTVKSSGAGVAIETSFCGPRPIAPEPSFDMSSSPVTIEAAATAAVGVPVTGSPAGTDSPAASDDGRNLIEEINRRSQYPLTKQDSYANAIYSSALRRGGGGGVRKQGSYEAAVESGVNVQAALRKGKQMVKMRKQDSYSRAIGGSFEESESLMVVPVQQQPPSRSPLRMRKQESYLKAVGEMSPENESSPKTDFNSAANNRQVCMRKQDSYLRAVGKLSTEEDELTPLPRRSVRSVRKQDSYQRAMQSGSLSFSESFEEPKPPTNRRAPVHKQDSYTRAILSSTQDGNNNDDQDHHVDRVPEYDRMLQELPDSGDDQLRAAERRAEEVAATAIQSAFKGYRTRKDIQEIQTFYRQVQSDSGEGGSSRSYTFEPLSLQKRQDSYLQAVGAGIFALSPEEEPTATSTVGGDSASGGGGCVVRSWKVRQDSYQRAMNLASPDQREQRVISRAKRQDSYLQAMDIEMLHPASKEERKASWSSRQDSYQKALEQEIGDGRDDDAEDPLRRTLQRVDTDSSSDDGGFHRSSSFKTRGYTAVTDAFVTKKPRKRQHRRALEQDQETKAAVMIQSVYRGFQSRKQLGTAAGIAQATVKLQAAFRGFKIRKNLREEKKEEEEAALKIQTVFRGHKSRQQFKSTIEVARAAMKIQAAYRGFKSREVVKTMRLPKEDSLPDLQCPEVARAAVKIQSVYKGFQTRRQMQSTFQAVNAALTIQRAYRRFKERRRLNADKYDLPDLKDESVKKAAVRIQSVYRGFQTRKEMKSTVEVARAAVVIQSAYRRFRQKKELKKLEKHTVDQEELPDLQCKDVKEAAAKIQAAYRGLQTRRQLKSASEVAQAAMKIQSAYRGFKVRREMGSDENARNEGSSGVARRKKVERVQASDDELPDLNSKDVADAALRIQSVYRGFQARKQVRDTAEVVRAAMKIQSVYRGFKTRKQIAALEDDKQITCDDLPDLEAEDVVNAALMIQSVFRGFQSRKQGRCAKEVAYAAIKIQRCYRKFRARKAARKAAQSTIVEADLPDLSDQSVKEAAVKIQTAFRGFQARKQDKCAFEVVQAVIKIQSAYRRFRQGKLAQRKKEVTEELPDLNAKDVQQAAVKIQAVYRGFQGRKQHKHTFAVVPAAITIQRSFRRFKKRKERLRRETPLREDLPDLESSEVQAATLKIQSVMRGHQMRKQKAKENNAAVAIQSAFKGFKTRKELGMEVEGAAASAAASAAATPLVLDFPDLKDEDVANAAVKIQSIYRGFQARKEMKAAAETAHAAVKIQSVYRGFVDRKTQAHLTQEKSDWPNLKEEDVQKAAVQLQSAYKGFKARKEFDLKKEDSEEDHLDLECENVAKATAQIQSAYEGYKTRKVLGLEKEKSLTEILPDLEDEGVAEAALKIQSVYRGFQARKEIKAAIEATHAAVTIQSVFRGFQDRKSVESLKEKSQMDEELPDLNSEDVAKAAVQIQSAYRGFQARKHLPVASSSPQITVDERDTRRLAIRKPLGPRQPLLTDNSLKEEPSGELLRHPGDVVAAAITIQRFFRKLQEKNKLRKKGRRRTRMASSSSSSSSSASTASSSTESKTPTERSTSSADSRSPPSRDDVKSSSDSSSAGPDLASSEYESDSDDEKVDVGISDENEAAHIIQKKFREYKDKKEVTKKKSKIVTEEEAAVKIQTAFKCHHTRKVLTSDAMAKALEITGSSTKKKPPQTPASSIDFDNVVPAPPGFGVQVPVKSPLPARSAKLKEVAIPKVPPKPSKQQAPPNSSEQSMAQSAMGMIRQSSLKNFFLKQEEHQEDRKPQSMSGAVMTLASETVRPKEEKKNSGGFFSSLLKRGDKKKKDDAAEDKVEQIAQEPAAQQQQQQQQPTTTVPFGGAKPKQTVAHQDDLIHVVLNAVEENWLNQAPQPTLDKAKALQQQQEEQQQQDNCSEPDTSDVSECSKSLKDEGDEEEREVLCVESGEADLPYLETTLPQERPGLVSITPAHARVSECRLASINRPRSASPKAASINDYAASVAPASKMANSAPPSLALREQQPPPSSEKIRVKLPKQDSVSRPRPKPESWDSFLSKGLQTFKNPETAEVEKKKKQWVNCDEPGERIQQSQQSQQSPKQPPPAPKRVPPPPVKKKSLLAPPPQPPPPTRTLTSFQQPHKKHLK